MRRAAEGGYPANTCRVIYPHGDKTRVCVLVDGHDGAHKSRDRERFPDYSDSEPVADVDSEGRLTTRHTTAGRVAGVERTLCGLRVPTGAQPAPTDAPACARCESLDA